MRRKLLILYAFYAFLFIPLLAGSAPVKWGKISTDEINITSERYNSDAVVLYDYGRFYFDLNNAGNRLFAYYDRHVRMKILTEEGLKHAEQAIKYYNLRDALYYEGEVIVLKAQAFNPKKNNDLERQRVKKRNMVYTDLEDDYTKVSFSFPDVKPGSIIEFKYRLATLDMINPDDWHFQWSIPVIWSEFRAEIPRNFIYQFATYNISQLDINEQDYYTQTLNWTFDTRREYFRGGVPLPGYDRRIYKGTFSVNGSSYRFVRKNVPPLKEKPFTGNINDYVEKVKLKLVRGDKSVRWGFLAQDLFKSVIQGYELRDKGEKEIMLIPAGYVFYQEPSLNELVEEMNKSPKFGLPLILHLNTNDTLSSLIENEDQDKGKMIAIYDMVRERMEWNGRYSVFLDEGLPRELIGIVQKTANFLSKDNSGKYINLSLKKPWEEKRGSSSEINMILINLLKKAGIEAYPVMISTVDNGKIDTSFFNLRRFNHVLAYARTSSGEFLLDAIHKNRPHYVLDKNDLNSPGLLIKKDTYEWIDIKNNHKSKHLINANLVLQEEGEISGSLAHMFYGQFALKYNNMINDMVNIDWKGSLYRQSKEKPFVLSTETETGQRHETSFKILQRVRYDDVTEKTENGMNFNPFSLISNQYNPFYESSREYPVDFLFPREYTFVLNIQFPENIRIKKMPSEVHYLTNDKSAYYLFQRKLNGNSLQLISKLTFEKRQYSSVEYFELLRLLILMEKKFKENFVIEFE